MAASPPLCHWIGLDGCPMFDKLWHLTPCAVAPVPLGRLAQSATTLSESFSVFVSFPFLLLFLTFEVWRGIVAEQWRCGSVSLRSQMVLALVCSYAGYFPNRAVCHVPISSIPLFTSSLQLVCPLCLSYVLCRSPLLQDRLSVSQLVRV